jgi:putative ABC transport system permease protein
MLMPLQTLGQADGHFGKASFFFVGVRQGAPIGETAAALEKRFPGYEITALEVLAEVMKENALGLREFTQVLSGLAALISFLVILLATYTMVQERTHQIGILKALGAGKLYILGIVLAESALICMIGVGVGFFLTLVARELIRVGYPHLAVMLTPQWFMVAALLAMGGGLLGALYPALLASRLDPVEALVHH